MLNDKLIINQMFFSKKVNLMLLSLMLLAASVHGQGVTMQQVNSANDTEVSIHKEVFYGIRQSDNADKATILREVAEFLKSCPDASIKVVGYADKGTGTPAQNVMYAMNRANQFKGDLVKKYGIDARRIIVESMGDTVQPFAENDKNRCVIIDGIGHKGIAKPVTNAVAQTTAPVSNAQALADAQRLKYQEEKIRRYEAEMARHRQDTVIIERVDTVWVENNDTVWIEPVDSLEEEYPFGLKVRNRWNNWFVNVGVGPGIYQGDHNRDAKWSDRLYPTFNLSFGKWIYPAFGFRVGADLDMVKMCYNGPEGYHYDGKYNDWLNKMSFNAWNFRADLMLNLSSFFLRPYSKRFFSIVPYAGLGYMAVWDNYFKPSLSMNAGVMVSVTVQKNLELTFDLRAKQFDDELNWYKEGHSQDGMSSLSVGLLWHFTKRGF